MDDTSAEPEHNSIPIHASLTTTLYSAKEDTDLPTLLMHALDGFQDSGNNEDTMAWNAFDQMEELGLSFGPCETDSHIAEERFVLEDVIPEDRSETPRPMASLRPPFEKWIKSISKKSSRRKRAASDSQILNTYDSHSMHDSQTSYRHRKSNSGSSFGFVTAMKSVSISMASTSIAPRSRATALSSKHQRTDRSSRASHIGPRSSEDSAYTARGVVIDAAVDNRALRRRKVIEEIISTEEGYCGDIKFLMTV